MKGVRVPVFVVVAVMSISMQGVFGGAVCAHTWSSAMSHACTPLAGGRSVCEREGSVPKMRDVCSSVIALIPHVMHATSPPLAFSPLSITCSLLSSRVATSGCPRGCRYAVAALSRCQPRAIRCGTCQQLYVCEDCIVPPLTPPVCPSLAERAFLALPSVMQDRFVCLIHHLHTHILY